MASIKQRSYLKSAIDIGFHPGIGLTRVYRFTFNGMEDEKETQTQDYGMRIYDGRLGRFLSVDPLAKSYPTLTPYKFASNTPISAIDLDGLEAWIATQRWSKQDKEEFGKYVQMELNAIQKRVSAKQLDNSTNFDCADLAVHMLIGYAKSKNLPVSFTTTDGQTISNSTESFTFTNSNYEQVTVKVTTDNFENLVRGFTNAKSLSEDMTNIPQNSKPVPGDMSNDGSHVNVVREISSQIDKDLQNAGYIPTVSGTMPAVEITEKRFTNIPESNYNWKLWKVIAQPYHTLPNETMNTIPQDNSNVGQNTYGGY